MLDRILSKKPEDDPDIASDDVSERIKAAGVWTAPGEEWDDPGLDGKPAGEGERWLYLARQAARRTHFERKAPYIGMILGFFDSAAAAGVDTESVTREKKNYYLGEVRKSATSEETDALIALAPDFWPGYKKALDLLREGRDNPERMKERHRQGCVEEAEEVIWAIRREDLSIGDEKAQDAMVSLRAARKECELFVEKKEETAAPYVGKIRELAPDKADEILKSWNDYMDEIRRKCERLEDALIRKEGQVLAEGEKASRRLEERRQKQLRDDTLRMILFTAIGLVALGLVIAGLAYAIGVAASPGKMLSHEISSFVWTAVILLLLLGLAMAGAELLLRYFTGKVGEAYRSEEPEPFPGTGEGLRFRLSRAVLAVLAILCGVLTLTSVIVTVCAGASFDRSIGQIKISSRADLELIRKHPAAQFVLTEDLDFEGTSWETVPELKGTLDGGGFRILNVVSSGKSLIVKNSGTVCNLTIHYTRRVPDGEKIVLVGTNEGEIRDVTVSLADHFLLTETNRGTIRNIRIENGILRYGLVTENEATVSGVTVSGCALQINETADKSTALVVTNRGTIENCVVENLTLSGKPFPMNELDASEDSLVFDAVRFGTVCCDNYGSIRLCSVRSLTTECFRVSESFGGIAAWSEGEIVSCSTEEANLVLWAPVFGGIVGEGKSVSDSVSAGSLNGRAATDCVYIGGIAGLAEKTSGSRNEMTLKIDLSFRYPDSVARVNGNGVGGVAGAASEAAICSNKGAISVSVYASDNGRASVRVGGILGSSRGETTVSDCCCTIGVYVYDKTGEGTNKPALYAAGIANATPEGKLTVSNSFMSAKISASSSSVGCVGGILTVPSTETNVSSSGCFFTGSLTRPVSDHGRATAWVAGPNAVNCYYSSSMSLKDNPDEKATPEESARLKSEEFLTGTLRWSASVWEFTDGKLPKLKTN
ncbi:MAG: right-handed parallel beta-helix repeat-containing protein [Clostridia bacterium]|nr:right-handed parallel beta-helix repeat-containing protein [Clostridia bacterium]